MSETASPSSDRLQGRCHCGAVGVSVPAASFGIVACHCDDCQKLHGNFFAMIAADRDEVRLDGAEALVSYASSTTVQRTFCRHCGSRVAKDAQGAPKLLLAAGLFGPLTGKRLRRNVWGRSKPDCYELPAEVAP